MKGRNGSTGLETTQQTSVPLEHVKEGREGQSFSSTLQRQPKNGRLVVAIAGLAIAFLLGVFFVSYGSQLYESWRERRLLEKATTLFQEGDISKAEKMAQ